MRKSILALFVLAGLSLAVFYLGENDWATVLTGPSVGLGSATNVESPGFAVNATGAAESLSSDVLV